MPSSLLWVVQLTDFVLKHVDFRQGRAQGSVAAKTDLAACKALEKQQRESGSQLLKRCLDGAVKDCAAQRCLPEAQRELRASSL